MLAKKSSNVRFSTVKSRSVTLIWEQEFDCDVERANNYYVKVADKPGLSRIIDHTFGNTSPSVCEHTLTDLLPGQAYHVIIVAGNKSGTVLSDDILVQTPSKLVTMIFFLKGRG